MRRRQSHLQKLSQLNPSRQESAFCQPRNELSSRRPSAAVSTFDFEKMAHCRALLLLHLLLAIAMLVAMTLEMHRIQNGAAGCFLI